MSNNKSTRIKPMKYKSQGSNNNNINNNSHRRLKPIHTDHVGKINEMTDSNATTETERNRKKARKRGRSCWIENHRYGIYKSAVGCKWLSAGKMNINIMQGIGLDGAGDRAWMQMELPSDLLVGLLCIRVVSAVDAGHPAIGAPSIHVCRTIGHGRPRS